MAYLTPEAILWARAQIEDLPKDQIGLVFALLASRSPVISYDSIDMSQRSEFLQHTLRYFGAPIALGAWGFFVPLDGKWRSDDYLMSTVMGRLLNGSHWWTAAGGFIGRNPSTGWPATFSFGIRGFEVLRRRTRPPFLTGGKRLPLSAMAIWYFRHEDIAESNLESLVLRYKEEINSSEFDVLRIFEDNKTIFWGDLTRSTDLTDDERKKCYPGLAMKLSPKHTIEIDQSTYQRLIEGAGSLPVEEYIKFLLKEKE